MLRKAIWTLLIIAVLFVSGCASRQPLPRILWPVPPEEPKLELKGVYYNDEDIAKSGFQRTVDTFTGGGGGVLFKSPFDIATNGKGIVYITDLHWVNVFTFNFNTKEVGLLFENPRIENPLSIDVRSDGLIYVTDALGGKVWLVKPDGIVEKVIQNQEKLVRPGFVHLDEKRNRMYVSDTKQHKVVVFDLTGNYLFAFGRRGHTEGAFNSPQGIATDSDGNIFVVDTLNARVQVFDPQGKFLRMFGQRGDRMAQFDSPKDIVIDSEGNLHITDGRKGQLLSYSSDGQPLLVTGDARRSAHLMGFSTPKGMCIDQNDVIYIADQLNKRFSMFQYLSKEFLRKHPITAEDKRRLQEYLQKSTGK